MNVREGIGSQLAAVIAAAALIGCGDHGEGEHHHPPPSGVLPSSTAVEAIDHDALFVVNGGDSTLSVIDAETDELRAAIALTDAAYPHHLYLSEDGARMLLAVPGVDLSGGHASGGHDGHAGGAVMLLDASTGATLKARRFDASNHNAVFAPSGSEAFTTQMGTSGTLLVLDASTLETKASVTVGAEPSEVTVTSTHAFVANTGSDTVSVVDMATSSVVETIAVGDGPVGAWQAMNGKAYVDNEQGKSLSVIDTATFEVTLTYELGFTPAFALVAPDGSLWVTDTDAGRVVVYSADEATELGEIATGAGAHAIAFSGDGARGYVSNQMDDSVSVMDVAARTVITTIPVGSKPNGLAWRAK